ncbi:MAG: PD-(D/E)XK motif protein [Verrucomicrobia bacterium]|nr:PD-(D/E)XK motif protein [Verrucomicrobiota bacterium]
MPSLLAAIEESSGRRALLLTPGEVVLPPRKDWPECTGLELKAVELPGGRGLALILREKACGVEFTTLAEDLAARVANARDAEGALSDFLGGLRRWQLFLRAGRDGLSPEQQRGLWGELQFLRRHILPALGSHGSLTGWKAPRSSHQDFQFPAGSIEVKTTKAMQPQNIRITSERQLDETGVGALFLHVVIVDEREVGAADSHPERTLPGLIDALRRELDPADVVQLNDLLLEAGWLDAHASRYDACSRTVRSEHTFRIGEGFPRLVERDLPGGVSQVSYSVSLHGCAAWEMETGEMLAEISR